ncbi:hypothetical protein DL96DRAFT_1723789 [Flagelloscypha sp. PMI_526]|nr:hypothetical protein DL96DRAFT_1723789 [Flagelloscypha sp. PMI_526]
MSTPKPGTVQHSELEPIYFPRSRTERTEEYWLFPIGLLFGLIAVVVGYVTGTSALKRFFLDQSYLWNWSTTSGALHINNYAEFYAGFLARCLTTPMAMKLFAIILG